MSHGDPNVWVPTELESMFFFKTPKIYMQMLKQKWESLYSLIFITPIAVDA